MKCATVWFLGTCLICLSLTVYAETRYVTDELNLALYELANSQGKLLKRLSSGTELELLQEEGLYAEVRTKDGSVGWTKAGFLIKSKPAKALLTELMIEKDQLKNALEAQKKQLSETKKALGDLEVQAQEANDELENKEGIVAALDRVQQENESLRARYGLFHQAIPLKWVLIAAGITFLLGIVAGMALFDYRSRRRHGGIRIY
jgi:SH3 domain protein